jgi:pimeloyl-ACP methyl ester carboxylesterase
MEVQDSDLYFSSVIILPRFPFSSHAMLTNLNERLKDTAAAQELSRDILFRPCSSGCARSIKSRSLASSPIMNQPAAATNSEEDKLPTVDACFDGGRQLLCDPGRKVIVDPTTTAKLPTADAWFAGGRRLEYDPVRKLIVEATTKHTSTIGVFERVALPVLPRKNTRWATFLPGFPDGSYGYAKVNQRLQRCTTPRIFVEYVGQGDSDKPKKYSYSTMERADLVEALWTFHHVKRTVLVTFDYSSLVMMELLQRQKERMAAGIGFPFIEHVLIVNGGLFADGHSHPFTTTPLKTWFGKMGLSMAQRSSSVFDKMLKPLYSEEYQATELTQQELREMEKAIRRHKCSSYMSDATCFVDEHKEEENSKRWNLCNIYLDFCKNKGITLHIVGSEKDQFEHLQIQLARERLGDYSPGVEIETIPGGHLSLLEQADRIVECIQLLVHKGEIEQPIRSCTSTEALDTSSLPSGSTVRQ